MKKSVVIATYNGEKYIVEQLESIMNQTVKPDEVLIYDDCSTDNTYNVVKQFISNNRLEKWNVKCNTVNLGWKRNFLKLLLDVSGDIIFYCDQDDIWIEDKIETICDILIQNKEIMCVATPFLSIDENGKLLDTYKKDAKYSLRKITPYSREFFNIPAGCTMGLKRNILSYVDLNELTSTPDELICRTAALRDGMYKFSRPLILHRYHQNNTSNSIVKAKCLSGSSSLDERKEVIVGHIKQLEQYININDDRSYDDVLEFERSRFRVLDEKNIGYVLRFLFKYKKIFPDAIIIGDIAYMLGIQKKIGYVYNVVNKIICGKQ